MRTRPARITQTAWAWLLIGGLGSGIGSSLSSLSSSAAEPTVPARRVAAPQRVHAGLLALYDFTSPDASLVQDRSGVGQRLDLRIADPKAVRRTEGGLEVVGQTLIRSEKPATRLIESIKQSGAITIEAWVRAAKTSQSGPARIVSLSHNPNERNFTLGQDGDKVEVRLRTTETSTNGIPAVASKAKSLTTELTHVLYTRDRAGKARIYINGKLNVEQKVGGAASNWDGAFQLALANELSNDRPWLGTYRLVAIYSRDLSPAEVEQHFQFISEWLNLGRLDNLRPDPKKFPKWDARLAADMREETLAFFEDVVWKQNRPLSDLLNAQVTLATPRLSRHYGLPLDKPAEDDKVIRYDLSNSPLGATSRARVADHLERIREFEQRVYAMKERDPAAPNLPPRSPLPHGGEADPGGEGIDITLDELTTEWRLTADLYALAIQIDRVRFGSITFLAASERIRLKGKYEYSGRTIFLFDDGGQRKTSGSNACSHEWWHDFDEKKKNEQLRAHAHMKMREVAYFLQRLAGRDCVEPNGRTILHSLLTISTESGDGRHNDVKRELSGVFHAITSANGRFKTGQILDVGAEGIDVYNTILDALGVSRRLGPSNREPRRMDAIRA